MQTLKDKGKIQMATDDSGRSSVNKDGTDQQIDTRLTQRGSRPVLWRLIDKDGNFIERGRMFDLIGLATRIWPDQEQDPERTGKGWDLEVDR